MNISIRSLTLSTAYLACSAGIGYLSTWSVTVINPWVGGLYSLNQSLIHEIFVPLFYYKDASSTQRLTGTIIEIACTIGITSKLCRELGMPLNLKGLLIVAIACSIVPFAIGLSIGMLALGTLGIKNKQLIYSPLNRLTKNPD